MTLAPATNLPDYDFTSHYLTRNGYRLHYLDEGSGQPLVMLHGNPTWSYLYRRFVTELRGSFRVIVPDHAGCGLSDTPPESAYRYTLSSRVADLEALLDSLSLKDRVTLFLHDWGGLIGMTYAARHPDRIARLVVFNTAAFLLPADKRLHWTLGFARNSRLAAWLILRFNAFTRLAVRLGCRVRPMPPAVRHAYTAASDSPEGRRVTLRFVQDIPLSHQDPAYSAVLQTQNRLNKFRHLPVLLCWGEKDFVFDRAFLREWIRHFPEAEVHRFPDAGHYVTEDAFDRILPLVRTFLSQPLSAVRPPPMD
ncbi:MAG: alpha/beta fold hydrolase [Acidobacteria bacterium]|nr:MAG: alpha/beta fold hydrolase [Acidobacteriota bacterium]